MDFIYPMAMFYLSLLSFFSFIMGLYFGLYVMRLNWKLSVNRYFFFIVVSFSFWMLGYTFIYSATDPETAFFWYRVSSLGWTFMPVFILHFCVDFTEVNRYLKTRWPLLLMYILPVILFVKSITGILFARGFEWRNGVIYEIPADDSPWFWLYMIYNIVFMLLSFFLLIRFMFRTGSARKRKQAMVIIISFVISLVSVYGFNVINLILKLNLPVIGHLSFLFSVAGIWFAISRYKLMVMSTTIATEKVLSTMMDLMILLDPEHKIILVNRQVGNSLGYDMNDLLGRDIIDFIAGDFTESTPETFDETFQNREVIFCTKNKQIVPVNLSASTIYDDFNEKVGTVIVGHDIRDKIALKEKNLYIEQELLLARKVQFSIMPSKPPVVDGLKITVIYQPMALLGGDFYDFIKLKEENLHGIFIGDVSGHGMAAALITSMIKILLDTAGEAKTKPSRLLEFINRKIINNTGDNYVTAWYGIYDSSEKILHYGRAGHLYPLLLRRGTITNLVSRGRLLGVFDDINTSEKSISLEKGDKILLFTDGLIEASDGEGAMFESVLNDYLIENFHLSISDLIQTIYEMAHAFCDNRFMDDVLIIGLEAE